MVRGKESECNDADYTCLPSQGFVYFHANPAEFQRSLDRTMASIP